MSIETITTLLDQIPSELTSIILQYEGSLVESISRFSAQEIKDGQRYTQHEYEKLPNGAKNAYDTILIDRVDTEWYENYERKEKIKLLDSGGIAALSKIFRLKEENKKNAEQGQRDIPTDLLMFLTRGKEMPAAETMDILMEVAGWAVERSTALLRLSMVEGSYREDWGIYKTISSALDVPIVFRWKY